MQYRDLYDAQRGRVHFLGTTFEKLPEQSLLLPNDRRVPLLGNVALAHESLSLTAWTKVPERDIPIAGSLVAPGGTYMVRGRYAIHPQSVYDESADTFVDHYGDERIEAIRLAHAALEAGGMTKQEPSPAKNFYDNELDYIVFTPRSD